MSPATCPRVNELKAFALGDLGDSTFLVIASHIERCPDCEALLQAFDDHADGLVTGLRDLQLANDLEATEPPEEWSASRKEPPFYLRARRAGRSLSIRADVT